MPSENDSKRFYWLKLEKDFFKRHDIRVVESMPNGKDYILFYLKLLCESTSHEGYLRFSPTIPYSEDMLATITNTNVDVVRSAIKIFTELKMMEVLDDGTFYLQQVQKMIGSATGQTLRKIESRDKKLLSGNSVVNLTTEIDIEKELEKDKEIDIEIEDKTRLNEIKANGFAGELFLKLVNCGYISLYELDSDDYIGLFKELLKTYDLVDIKVKLDYFIHSCCHYLPTGERDKQDKPIYAYRYKEDEPIANKFNYLKTSLEKAWEEPVDPFPGLDELIKKENKNQDDDGDDSLPF